MIKKILITCGILIVLGACFCGWYYQFAFKPYQLLTSSKWREQATPNEIRKLAQELLTKPLIPEHDIFLDLEQYGNEESIPYLLASLKSMDDGTDNHVCTYSHCVDALKKITGKDFGNRYESWEKGLKLNH